MNVSSRSLAVVRLRPPIFSKADIQAMIKIRVGRVEIPGFRLFEVERGTTNSRAISIYKQLRLYLSNEIQRIS